MCEPAKSDFPKSGKACSSTVMDEEHFTTYAFILQEECNL